MSYNTLYITLNNLVLLLILLIFSSNNNYAFESSDSTDYRLPDTTIHNLSDTTIHYSSDTTIIDSLQSVVSDTIKLRAGEIVKRKTNNSLDTIVNYNANDSAVFNVKNKTLRLSGNSNLKYQQQELKAGVIELYLSKSVLKAVAAEDSAGKMIGYPKFVDKGEEFVGKEIVYNYKTNQGTIAFGETEVSEGFYFGTKIKRASEDVLFIKDGVYTTCDAPHSHYFFGSPEMKVVAKDRVFIDPLVFFVEDMPIFIVPFGLFFPSKGGRQSGVVIPSFFFSKNRGVTFQDMGMYFALSDYYDTKIMADYYSKGGYTLKNFWRWKFRDELSGNMEMQYGKTRMYPDDPWTQNWSFLLNHNQSLTPQSRITANVNFASQNFNKNTSTNLNDRVTQNITSNASYSKTFNNRASFSIGYNRNQNIITDEYSQSSSLSYSLPQMKPLSSLIPNQSWLKDLKDLSFSYSVNTKWEESKNLKYNSIEVSQDSSYIDTTFSISPRRKIMHNPSISISPKFGYFTLQPSINFGANNYFRRLTRTFNQEDSSVSNSYENGFFTEYQYSLNLSLSTRLFGIAKPEIFGINAVRHTFQPTVAYSFRPDMSDPSYGFYDSYFDENTNRELTYSRFEKDGGGIAPRMESQSLNYNILNSVEAKIAQGDTIPDKNVEWLRLTMNGSFNFAADSLRFSDIAMTFRTPNIGDFSFSGNAAFTLYDEEPAVNSVTGELTDSYSRVDRFLWDSDKGLARLTRFSLQLSTSFSSDGSSSGGMSFGSETKEKQKSDSLGLGERFQNRMEYQEEKEDYFGDNLPGFSPFSIPWNLQLGLNYQYNQQTVNRINRTINLSTNFSLNLTSTLSIRGSADYDFVNKELIRPQISLTKDLHCWQLAFRWYPIGPSRGFYLRFGVKASQLSDLKLEKQSGPIY